MKKMDNMANMNNIDSLDMANMNNSDSMDMANINDSDSIDMANMNDSDSIDMANMNDSDSMDMANMNSKDIPADNDETGDMDDIDKLIQAAFTQMMQKEYSNRPKKFPKHRFTRRFRRNMDELLRTGKAPAEKECKPVGGFSLLELMRPVRSRRAILIVAALVVLLFGTTASGTNPIIVWLHDSWMEQHGDYVEIQNREKNAAVSKKAFCKYELAEVPEGYEVVREEYNESVGIYYMTYADKDGNLFIFKQAKRDNGNLGNVTANRKDMEEVSVGNLTGYYVRDAESNNLVLSDEEYMLIFSGELPKEELLEIAAGLHAVE